MATKDYKIKFKTTSGTNYTYYLYDDNSVEYEGTNPKMTEDEWARKLALIKYVTDFMKMYPKNKIEIDKL